MAIYKKETRQYLPIGIAKAWEFLSSPLNLKEITPASMGFEITNGVGPKDRMYAGQIIVYKLKPLPFYKTEWVTEISKVDPYKYFIDEQRFGPYLMWHHLHKLTPFENGVLMEDTVHYKLPFGIIGRLMHTLFIRKQIDRIFEFRRKKLEEMFG